MTYDLSGDGRAVARGGYGRFYDKTHFELISGILTSGVFSDSFKVFFPTNNADPGPSNGTIPTDPMLAGGPTVNRALLDQRYPAGHRIRNTGTVVLDSPDRGFPTPISSPPATNASSRPVCRRAPTTCTRAPATS